MSACSPLIPVDGSSITDLAGAVRLRPDSNHPLLLRGLDGIALDVLRIPSAFDDFAYVFAPGKHTLWASSVPYGLPLIPQTVSCYVIEVELGKGASFVLAEDREHGQALVFREDTGQQVAAGRLVDRPWVFERGCRWQ